MYIKIYNNKGYNRNLLLEAETYRELGRPKRVDIINCNNEYLEIIPKSNGQKIVREIPNTNCGVIKDTRGIGKFMYGRYFGRITLSPKGKFLRVFNKYNQVNGKLGEKNIFYRPYVSESDMQSEEHLIKIILYRFEKKCTKCKKCMFENTAYMSNCIYSIIEEIEFKDNIQKNIILSFFEHFVGNVVVTKNYEYGKKMALSMFKKEEANE